MKVKETYKGLKKIKNFPMRAYYQKVLEGWAMTRWHRRRPRGKLLSNISRLSPPSPIRRVLGSSCLDRLLNCMTRAELASAAC